MADNKNHLNHIAYTISIEPNRYRSKGQSRPQFPERIPIQHGAHLRSRYREAISLAEEEISGTLRDVLKVRNGYYLEFESATGADLRLESLDASGLELMSVREEGDKTIATVFVLASKTDVMLGKIEKYMEEPEDIVNPDGTLGKKNPANQALVAPIEDIRIARLLSIWKDDIEKFPAIDEQIWWEIWVSNDRLEDFRRAARENIVLRDRWVRFAERSVFAAFGTPLGIDKVRMSSGSIAELSKINDTAVSILTEPNTEQREWVDELLERVDWPDKNAPRLCLLDTGVNNGHRLISELLSDEDMHSCNPDWPTQDVGLPNFHGTGMAGVCLYGNLLESISSSEKITIPHRLESVRIIAPNNDTPRELYGTITDDAVSQVELQSPTAERSYCLAITAEINNAGEPSEWSASIDNLTFNDGDKPRLFCVATGNVRDLSVVEDYFNKNVLESIEDPAQAWNSLTIGGYTEKTHIDDDGYENWSPIAGNGDLGPCSRTSYLWEHKKWPIKPDVLFEAGNWARNSLNTEWDDGLDSLSLLTTHHNPVVRQFDSINSTSAATALASNLVAKLTAQYPDYWPETIRGLIVHGAHWTEPMFDKMSRVGLTERGHLLRAFGYGAASEDNSISSANHRCTIITEQTLQPFTQDRSSIGMNEMHIIPLPLPKDKLEEIGNVPVKLKVTLSYFIEPNPSRRGYSGRYTYPSHGLRFILQRANESVEALQSRAGRLGQTDEDQSSTSDSDRWFLGTNQRNKGCLISDIWETQATDLAQHDNIVVYPIGGWWKYRPSHNKGNNPVRYSLIMSIEVDDETIDIYNDVKTVVETLVDAQIEVEV